MFGKIRKSLKKVVKNDPVHKATGKVLKKTGGPVGRALGSAMTGGAKRKSAASVGAAAGGTGPTTLGTGRKLGMSTGGNARASSVAPAIKRGRTTNSSPDTKLTHLGMSWKRR